MDHHHEPIVCFILGVTTTWTLLPALLGLYYDNIVDNTGYILILMHIVVALVSNMHWCNHRRDSWIAWVDTLVSCLTVILLVLRMGCAQLYPCFFLGLSGVWYNIGVGYRYGCWNMLGMWFHVLFRVCIFWFSFIVMVPTLANYEDMLFIFPFLNIVYFSHIYVNVKKKWSRFDYIEGNVILGVVILVCMVMVVEYKDNIRYIL